MKPIRSMWLEDTKIPQGNCKLGFEGKAQDPPTAPALARLAQDEESGLCGGDARSGGRLGGITRRKREIVGLRNERVRSVFLEIDAFHRERHIPIRRGRSRYEVKQVYIADGSLIRSISWAAISDAFAARLPSMRTRLRTLSTAVSQFGEWPAARAWARSARTS